MQQTSDEARFIPFAIEKGKTRRIQKIRLAYSLLLNLNNAHASRLSLFRQEARGYPRALSYSHNHARYKSSRVLLPRRESAQIIARTRKISERARAQKDDSARRAIKEDKRRATIALKYGARYGTTSMGTIIRAQEAGIVIRRDKRAQSLSNAEIARQILSMLSSDKTGENDGTTRTANE